MLTSPGMDRKITKKKGLKRKHLLWGIVAIAFLYFTGKQLFGTSVSTYNVERNKLTVKKVVRDKFSDYISISGIVKPITTVYMDAYEAGRVTASYIEEGSMVKKGDVILKLENNALFGQILTNENDLATKQNNLRQTRINFESQKIIGQRNRLEAYYRLKKAKRKHGQYRSLYEEDLVAREEYVQAEEAYELAEKQLEVIKMQTHQDSLMQLTTIKELDIDLQRMKKTLDLVYERMDHLVVRAPADGQLGMLNAEIGQRITQGERIAQINILSDFKIESGIDEHYIDRVTPRLPGTITRNDTVFDLHIKKIYPEVHDGKFKVDLVFTDGKPNKIRTGQSYYIKLRLGAVSEAVLVPRGSFFQSTGGQWIYVIDPSGDFAVKRTIKIGKQNPQYYEILEGLEPGEDVIISGYEAFGDNDRLSLN